MKTWLKKIGHFNKKVSIVGITYIKKIDQINTPTRISIGIILIVFGVISIPVPLINGIFITLVGLRFVGIHKLVFKSKDKKSMKELKK